MAEYYAVLSKAVAGLEPNAPETRRAVYDKARNALIGQLKAIDPPLPTSEISRQRLELEEAIRRVERESSAAPVSTPVRPSASRAAATAPPLRAPAPAPVQAPPSAPATPRAQPAPEAVAPAIGPQERRSPQDMFRRAMQDADRARGTEPSRPPVAPVVAAAGREETAWKVEPAVNPAPQAPRPAHLSAPASAYADEPSLRAGEPGLAPSYQDDEVWDLPEPAVEPMVASAPRVDVDGRKGASRLRRARSDDFADDVAERARPSRLPGIILTVLILALIGGVGAFAYSQRDFVASFVTDIVAGLDAGSEVPQQQAAPAQAIAENGAGKDPDRLLGGGEAPAAPGDDVRVVTPGSDGSAPAQEVAAAAPAPSAAPAADAGPLVAQRAILYEEPLDATDSSGVIAVNAAVTWRYDPNGIDGPEVVGNVDVPERNLSLRITLRRNVDDTLPASHIVEVVTDAKSGFPGRSVRDIPRFVLKASEEARGQPLIGASAKVADGFFWIALSGVPVDVSANLELLREQSWIDLPIVYETGQRAILTFEKGTPGERAFQSVLSAWAGQG